MHTLGLLIAGGRGRRLGRGIPKARVEVGGRTLLSRAMACLGSCCDEVRVVAPKSLGLDVPPDALVEDPPGERGPLTGLVAGLEAATFDRAIVLGVDYPLVRPGFLTAIADLLDDGGALAAAPEVAGMLQPLVAAYAPGAGPRLAAQVERGERALIPAARSLPLRIVTEAELARFDGGMENLMNVNTPGDLVAAEQRLGART